MPNWCSTYVRIKASEASLDVIERELDNATDGRYPDTDFGNTWLGNLLLHIGKDRDFVMYGDVRCRGWLDDWERKDGEIAMHMESAWVPHVKCVKMFCDHFVNDAVVLYTGEEFGYGVFWSNDPDFIGTVNVDIYDSGDVPEKILELQDFWSDPKETVTKALVEILGHEGTYQELTKEVEDMFADSDSYVKFNEYVDISYDNV